MIKKYAIPIYCSCLLLLCGSSIYAQKGVVASGGEASGSGGTVSYSIGQVDYIATSGGNGNTNEGLQQPYEFFTMGIEDNLEISLLLSVYPNPTTTFVNLKIDKENLENLSYELYDMDGKKLSSQKIKDKITNIPMELFPSATYILQVLNSTDKIKSFKIIKK